MKHGLTSRAAPRRRLASGGLRAAAALIAVLGAAASVAEALTVVSWGGAYGRASKAAVMDPFARESGVEVRIDDYNGGLSQIRAQVETGQVGWDVVDLEAIDLVRGCDEGLLEIVEVKDLAPAADGTPAAKDYVDGTLTDCGPAQIYYANIYAYNREVFEGLVPTTIGDFFDLEKFPGRRGMRRAAEVNLEFALIADGVPIDEVYATLDTPEGVDRAFRKLDSIKSQVVWWEAGAQPPQMLADKEVTMTTAYNGRIFNAQVLEKQPFVTVWDGQLLSAGGFGIVAGTPNLEAARRFVRFASMPATQARVSQYISYGPVRRSAMPLVSKHLATGVVMDPYMPTSDTHLGRALQSDWEWWGDHADEMNERFGAWLAR